MDEQHPARIVVDSLGGDERLDRLTRTLEEVADRLIGDHDGPRARALRGEWLGHPLHPMLTDLPIGFWTSAFLLDFGGRRLAAASKLMVAAGLISAIPTAAAGLADLRDRDETADRRIGAAHAVANSVALLFYSRSLWHRLRGRRLRGVMAGMAGAAAATAGGYLGGHLAFGETPTPSAQTAATAEEAGIVDQQGAALAMAAGS
jgi:uncharacterized membrane protein